MKTPTPKELDTADDGFHTMLEAWEEIEVRTIPQWSGLHDAMYVYRRAPQ